MANGIRKVLVLGGCGFIGRHAVAALRARGCEVAVGSRHPWRHAVCRRHAVEGRKVRFERLLRAEDWSTALAGVDAVINCVGILRQRGRETYARVHHEAVGALALACAAGGQRLVHVSALGLASDSRSRFLRSKLDGEAAIRRSGAQWRIVRPSLLDAENDGFGARWIRRVARWPLHPVPAQATGRIAAMHVGDLADALAILALEDEGVVREGDDREFELGGAQSRNLVDYLADLRSAWTSVPARVLRVPAWIARPASHACDLLHLSPFSFGHLELLGRDNCPERNRLAELLGRPPLAVAPHCSASGALVAGRGAIIGA